MAGSDHISICCHRDIRHGTNISAIGCSFTQLQSLIPFFQINGYRISEDILARVVFCPSSTGTLTDNPSLFLLPFCILRHNGHNG